MIPTDAERRARLTSLAARCELATVQTDDGEFTNWCLSHDLPATHAYSRPVPTVPAGT